MSDPLTDHLMHSAAMFDPFAREVEIDRSRTALPEPGPSVQVERIDEPERKRPSAIVESGIRPRSFDGPEEF
jgi:hypothetical protein